MKVKKNPEIQKDYQPDEPVWNPILTAKDVVNNEYRKVVEIVNTASNRQNSIRLLSILTTQFGIECKYCRIKNKIEFASAEPFLKTQILFLKSTQLN